MHALFVVKNSKVEWLEFDAAGKNYIVWQIMRRVVIGQVVLCYGVVSIMIYISASIITNIGHKSV